MNASFVRHPQRTRTLSSFGVDHRTVKVLSKLLSTVAPLQYARVNEIENFLINVMKVDDQKVLDSISPESLILMPVSHKDHFKHLPFVEFSDTIDGVFMVERSIFYGLTPTFER